MSDRVYFAASCGRIKIGYSENVDRRMKALGAQLLGPLTLIGSMEGGIEIERAIQARLKEFRLRGEWFTDCDEVRRLIYGVLASGLEQMGVTVRERAKAESPRLLQNQGQVIPKLARIMWPDSAVAELSALTGQPEEITRKWMEGSESIPRLVRLAFAATLVMWMVPLDGACA